MKTFAERQALYGKGSEFFAEERFAEALDCFQRLAADIPNNFVTQNFLGMTRLRMGEAAKALVNFSIAEQLAAHSGFSEKMKPDGRNRYFSIARFVSVSWKMMKK